MADVRLDALHILMQVEIGPGFAQDLIASRISTRNLDPRDASLLAEIVYGVIRHRLTLDSVVAAFSRIPLRKIDPKCLCILRMGIYQILFLDRIPAPAVVNESVRLISKARVSSAKGFVNAVLRAALRSVANRRSDKPGEPAKTIPIRENVWAVFNKPILPEPAAGLPDYLAAAYSHPCWLVARWLRRFGEEAAVSIMRTGNQVPPLTARVNRLKTDRASLLQRLREEGVEAEEGEMPLAIRLGAGTKLNRLSSFAEGLFQVQDETSMRVVELLDPRPGEAVLDLCAAPGGKTTQIAEMMRDQGTVIAADRSPARLQKLKENLDRLGIGCVRCAAVDSGVEWMGKPAVFDRALVDVPCSNTGVLGRRVEARWRLTLDHIPELARLQKTLLKSAAEAVRPGGLVAYSTCSIEEEENEAVVADVVESGLLSRQTERLFLPRFGVGGGYVALLCRPVSQKEV